MIQDTERFKMDLVGGMYLEGSYATLGLYANTCSFSVGANTQWSVDGLMLWQTRYNVWLIAYSYIGKVKPSA